jgi:hypothetical protein
MGVGGPHPTRFITLLLDVSDAMREPLAGDDQSRLEGVIEGITRFNRDWGGGGLRGVALFGLTGDSCDPADFPALTQLDTDEVPEYLSRSVAMGSERWTFPALLNTTRQAAALADSQAIYPGESEVLLVTAGEPSLCRPVHSADDIAELRTDLEARDGAAPPIHVVELGTGFDLNPIARAGGTNHVFAIQSGDLAEQFSRMLYAVSYGSVEAPLVFVVPQPQDGRQLILETGTLVYSDLEVPRVAGINDCGEHGGWWYEDDGTQFTLCECTSAEVVRATGFDFGIECERGLPPN